MIPYKRFLPAAVTIIIFISCLSLGYYFSAKKPIWGDEVYTQVEIIQKHSVKQILLGQMEQGSISPLFYLQQKVISSLTGFHFNLPWIKGTPEELRARSVLRIGPNIAMSAAVAAIFFFFWKFYGPAAGLFALGFALTEKMILAYWPDARPYGLWFLLTTLQSLVFLWILRLEKPKGGDWAPLAIIQALLPMCVVLSLPQIVAVSVLLWIWKDRNWRLYIFLTTIPAIIGLYYYSRSLRLSSKFYESPGLLIANHFSLEDWVILFGCGVLWAMSAFRPGEGLKIRQQFDNLAVQYLGLALVMLACAALLLLEFKLGEKPDGTRVAVRYFIFLSPVSIIAVMLLMLETWKRAQASLWMRTNLVILVTGMVIVRVLKTFIFYVGYYINGILF